MANNLTENLKLLCSYGKSTSEICRKAGINRQQFSKYLNGHASPSLSTLRRICDFFGVEESELFLEAGEFRGLIRLRPPRLGIRESHFNAVAERLAGATESGCEMLERQEGDYHTYTDSFPQSGIVIRALSHLYAREGKWFVKTVERNLDKSFMLPPTLKYQGIVTEGSGRICVFEREAGAGRSLGTTMLYPSDHSPPMFLAGVLVGFSPEGSKDINCVRTVWQYLGRKPDLRDALGRCGVVDTREEALPDFVIEGIGNDLRENETAFAPRY